MPRDSRQTTTGKVALTSATIVARALALAGCEGLEAVTIRRLAKDLGVTPMALYWHVRNKDELLDGMAARLFDEIDVSVDVSATWPEQLRELLGAMVGVLRDHPTTAPLLSTRTVSTEGSLRATEVLLDILRRVGFSPAEATQVARHALTAVTNLVADESGAVVRDEPEELADVRRRALGFLTALPPDRYPRLVEAAKPLSEGVAPDAYIAFGLDLLLAGIEAMSTRQR